MSSLQGFNAAEVEPQVGYDPLPAGEYRVCIVNSEMRPTKAGTGTLINLELQVLDGPYQNRKVFDRINYSNPNPTAQKIGLGTLSAICRSVGILTPQDTTQLHNRPLRAKVKVVNDDQYGPKNEVSSYSADKAGPSIVEQAAAMTYQAAAQQAPGPQNWAAQVRQ